MKACHINIRVIVVFIFVIQKSLEEGVGRGPITITTSDVRA